MFDPESMSTSRRQEFEVWYDALANDAEYVFNLQHEREDYCTSDVKLLKEGCITFCSDFETVAGFNPMEHATTIASACNLAYRKNWMPENKISVEPVHGWRMKQQQSREALEWLHYVDREIQCIEHAGNMGERRLRHGSTTFLVDGFDPEINTVFEYHGCFYHACPSCFPNREQKHLKHLGLTNQGVYEKTLDKTKKLRSLGYNVIEKWSCEWEKEKAADSNIAAYVETLKIVEPLKPRNAFFDVCLHDITEDEEEIRYVDFTSLYPWVNKCCEYPVGYPTIISQPDHTDISQYFGVAKVNILPPKQLYHPVLPQTVNGKLTFPLCRSCVQDEQVKPMHERRWTCQHRDDERMLTGEWCTEELKLAVEMGYVIHYIYEIWNFTETSMCLFTEYVNTWLKIKQEASGWPSWVGSDRVKRQQYIDEYASREIIQLDPDKIQKNPGLRSLAKLMLNSFWGEYHLFI